MGQEYLTPHFYSHLFHPCITRLLSNLMTISHGLLIYYSFFTLRLLLILSQKSIAFQWSWFGQEKRKTKYLTAHKQKLNVFSKWFNVKLLFLILGTLLFLNVLGFTIKIHLVTSEMIMLSTNVVFHCHAYFRSINCQNIESILYCSKIKLCNNKIQTYSTS